MRPGIVFFCRRVDKSFFSTTETTIDNLLVLLFYFDDNWDNFRQLSVVFRRARRAYKIRPVVYVVVIFSAKLSDSELSFVVYVVVLNHTRILVYS